LVWAQIVMSPLKLTFCTLCSFMTLINAFHINICKSTSSNCNGQDSTTKRIIDMANPWLSNVAHVCNGRTSTVPSKSPIGCTHLIVSTTLVRLCVGILIEKHLRLRYLKKICYFRCNCKEHLLNSKFDQWSICFYYQALDCSFGFKCLESSKGKLFQQQIKFLPLQLGCDSSPCLIILNATNTLLANMAMLKGW
jgi:hypothetical protein